jgi:hypothetical protein
MKKVKIVTFVPLQNADEVREAMGRVGAGLIGEYSYCSYSVIGKGRFVPSANASPHIGKPNIAEVVDEERIEIVCDRSIAKDVISAMRKAHPYEEVAFDIYELVDESELNK